MADPFSIFAGTVGVAEVGLRLCKYLKDLKAAVTGIETELTTLIHDVETHIAVNDVIQRTFTDKLTPSSSNDASTEAQVEVSALWEHISKALTESAVVLREVEALVSRVIGQDGPRVWGRWDGLKKELRRQAKQEDFQKLRQRLNNHQRLLQVLLGAIQLWYQTRPSRIAGASLGDISDEVRKLRLDLTSQLGSLQSDADTNGQALRSAALVASSVPLNKYFMIPQSVSSIYTGRKHNLLGLKTFFDSPMQSEDSAIQKRFVVYGLGGSGKTQFSCKFAQENRQSFWGIFWIDASSKESIAHSYNRISRIGGVELNVAAAKHWLSTLEYPWMLVIDSADDPKLSIEEYFPEGERGHILVTTRNPSLRLYGTVGPGSYHFEKMDNKEANDLLLKAAGMPIPSDPDSMELASIIAKTLGYLPLALIHAGKAILDGVCTLSNYLSHYERNWSKVSCLLSKEKEGRDESNWNVYSSYEVIYQSLESSPSEESRDAIDVLRVFSFMHCEGIKMGFFTKAAKTPSLEQEQSLESSKKSSPRSWSEALSKWTTQILLKFLGDFGDAALPAVLRAQNNDGSYDEIRLRLALKQLNQMSLVSWNHGSGEGTLSMHPLVHEWVRKRMKPAEQALWCQLTATFVAQCILLPPLGGLEEDENIRRDLVTHLDHVSDKDVRIKRVLANNLAARRIPWPPHTSRLSRAQIRRLAKFSRVYSQCGRWGDTEHLQTTVKEYLTDLLGPDHSLTIDIRLALSNTFWQQSKYKLAAKLQVQAYDSCVKSLGAKDPKTLKVMTMLGITYEYQGRFSKAIGLQEDALASLREKLGDHHEETLNAFDNLGRVNWRYWRYEKAAALHLRAVEGMTSLLGPHHLSTLTASENLAITYLEQGGADRLKSAEILLTQVREQRKIKLGKESPYTLLAICNLARVKSANGRHRDAELDLLGALPIAERNLGKDHVGVLAGRMYLALTIARQNRYHEAEIIFKDVIQPRRYLEFGRENGEHPDRLMAMWLLATDCYQKVGRLPDALHLCYEIDGCLRGIGGQGHPFAEKVNNRIRDIEVSTRTAVDERARNSLQTTTSLACH
ncbi:MAG: hypothetical protein Q9219_002964 [cf. Caloplaca sp. 3 TL-2023]